MKIYHSSFAEIMPRPLAKISLDDLLVASFFVKWHVIKLWINFFLGHIVNSYSWEILFSQNISLALPVIWVVASSLVAPHSNNTAELIALRISVNFCLANSSPYIGARAPKVWRHHQPCKNISQMVVNKPPPDKCSLPSLNPVGLENQLTISMTYT